MSGQTSTELLIEALTAGDDLRPGVFGGIDNDAAAMDRVMEEMG